MIEVPTVLILGAGASFPYGLPLGGELSQRIINDTADRNGELRRFLTIAGAHDDLVEKFRIAFSRSATPSIDAFLARREEFTLLGKLVIAHIIKRCEAPHLLWNRSPATDDWYPYLWHHLGEGPLESFRKNKVSIITFNYDRSLETFLLEALLHNYQLEPPENQKALQETIQIIHVYGTVEGDYGSVPQDNDECVRLLQASAANIRVIPEGRDATPELVECQKLLLDAEKICFLGFGYDASNLARLRANETIRDRIGPSRQRLVIGTTKGLFEREAVSAAARCGHTEPARARHGSRDSHLFPDMTCLELLRTWTFFDNNTR
jgi:hypothetical protein